MSPLQVFDLKCTSHICHECYMSCPCHPSWSLLSNNEPTKSTNYEPSHYLFFSTSLLLPPYVQISPSQTLFSDALPSAFKRPSFISTQLHIACCCYFSSFIAQQIVWHIRYDKNSGYFTQRHMYFYSTLLNYS